MSTASHFTGSHGTMYYVRNMKKSSALYAKKLGLKATYESEYWTEFDVKGVKICLHLADKSMKKFPGGIMILNVKGMTALIAKLKKAGVKIVGKPHKVHGDEYTIDFLDLDKNLVNLYGKLK